MKAALAFGMSLLLFSLFGDDHGLQAVLRARRDVRRLGSDISALRAENAALGARTTALRRDPAAIEAEARTTLGFIRPGEIAVVLARRPTGRP